ncbi:MAG TPA: hypothetical protein VFV87_10875 [Pirellulaceae bacterium]|nr:hypothetical protein [Pirellulaceae bacterium]
MVFAFAARTLRSLPAPFSVRCTALALVALIAGKSAICGAQDYDLRAAPKAGSHQQVRVTVEIEGKLKLNAAGQEVQHVPLTARADLHYVERMLQSGTSAAETRLARHYYQAEAKIRLRDSELASKLRDERRLILLDANADAATLFSPLGPLTRDELELIEAPASSLALTALLPKQPLKLGGQWDLEGLVVSRLLGLEAVSQQNVKCQLESAKEGIAVASLEGTVSGAVGGVSSDCELKGKLNFDLNKRVVTWLTLAIKENRAIGHAQPGFEVLTTLKMVAAPCAAAVEVNDKALSGLQTTADSGQTLIDFTADKAGFQLLHDRRWRVMIERHDATILRLVDRGDLISQCNISPLPTFTKGEQLTLEGFQNDVKQALGKDFGQVIEAAQEAGEDGLIIQRVIVAGVAGELPIQWTYYHVTDDKGHRASLVFTIEGNLVERFAQIDRELVSGFRFLPDKLPTPAVAPKEVTARNSESAPAPK